MSRRQTPRDLSSFPGVGFLDNTLGHDLKVVCQFLTNPPPSLPAQPSVVRAQEMEVGAASQRCHSGQCLHLPLPALLKGLRVRGKAAGELPARVPRTSKSFSRHLCSQKGGR